MLIQYLKSWRQVVFEEPELDGCLGVFEHRQHHYPVETERGQSSTQSACSDELCEWPSKLSCITQPKTLPLIRNSKS